MHEVSELNLELIKKGERAYEKKSHKASLINPGRAALALGFNPGRTVALVDMREQPHVFNGLHVVLKKMKVETV